MGQEFRNWALPWLEITYTYGDAEDETIVVATLMQTGSKDQGIQWKWPSHVSVLDDSIQGVMVNSNALGTPTCETRDVSSKIFSRSQISTSQFTVVEVGKIQAMLEMVKLEIEGPQ